MADFFITFREALEAGLVIGVVSSYLLRTEQRRYLKYVWWGTGAGLLVSVVIGMLLVWYASGLEGRAEELFEGVTMLVAAGLLVTMMAWMKRQRGHAQKIEQRVESHIEKKYSLGIVLLVFFSVVREGVETVIFLMAAANLAQGNSILSAILGVAGACAVILIFFTVSKRIPLKVFFKVSTIILALFAAGLFAHGIHEFQEAGILTFLSGQLYSIDAYLPETGTMGELMKSVFGYNANPSTLEVIAYVGGLVALWYLLRDRRAPAVAQTQPIR